MSKIKNGGFIPLKVVIQKPDLDTCLTALILGVTQKDELVVLKSEAPYEYINDPQILCIEAGGSGLVNLNNFDHHNTKEYFPPACKQAAEYSKITDLLVLRLVEYVSMVDEGNFSAKHSFFPTLSDVFSGMLLVENDTKQQFFRGIDILKKVLSLKIDPFGEMPYIDEWKIYIDAKIENRKKLYESIKNVEFIYLENGLKLCFLESEAIGGMGELYSKDCDVVILFNPKFGNPPVAKYTIASNKLSIFDLVEVLNKIEPGWGGRDRIIGSPRTGTSIKKELLIEIICSFLSKMFLKNNKEL